jgi:hypothetical protein
MRLRDAAKVPLLRVRGESSRVVETIVAVTAHDEVSLGEEL